MEFNVPLDTVQYRSFRRRAGSEVDPWRLRLAIAESGRSTSIRCRRTSSSCRTRRRPDRDHCRCRWHCSSRPYSTVMRKTRSVSPTAPLPPPTNTPINPHGPTGVTRIKKLGWLKMDETTNKTFLVLFVWFTNQRIMYLKCLYLTVYCTVQCTLVHVYVHIK